MSNTSNDITGDRITNALKGDKDKYREGWEAIFGDKKNKEVDEKKGFPMTRKEFKERCSEQSKKILDEITQRNEDMGLYDDK